MKVLYILGRGRSGSTILANVLGEVPGFFSAGELRVLWDPVIARNAPCGCGVVVTECPLWSVVLSRLRDVDPSDVARWQHEIVRESNIFRLLRKDASDWHTLQDYARVTNRLYKEIQDVTGCSVIIDSSKRPSYGAFLRLLEDGDPYYVHLARDPRASAYSWQSRRHESIHGDEVKQRNAVDSTVRWNLLNIGSEVLLKRVGSDHGAHLRYEDFVARPRATVQELCDLVGTGSVELPFLDDRTVELGPNHTIAGNPSRFSTGRLEIRDTQEWKTKQDATSRWLATAVALPFLRRYRYRVRV